MGSKRKWFNVIKVLAPLIIGAVKPELAPITNDIVDGIEGAEELFEKGSDKLKHVKEIANHSADVFNRVKGKEIVDKKELDNAVTKAVETVIAVTNMVDKASKDEPQG